MTKDCWRSIDAHFQNGEVTELLSVLPIKTANTFVLNGGDQINTKFPYLQTKNCWRSIDAHFQNGAVTVLLSVFPIQTANWFGLHGSDQLNIQLPYLQDQKSLTLRWRSF